MFADDIHCVLNFAHFSSIVTGITLVQILHPFKEGVHLLPYQPLNIDRLAMTNEWHIFEIVC